VIVLGYAAMVFLGLLPLAGLARYTGVEAERVFFFDTPVALALALVIGAVACIALGRGLGLLTVDSVGAYEQRRVAAMGSARVRRRTRVTPPVTIRSTAATALRF
jgi:hypothetical protein